MNKLKFVVRQFNFLHSLNFSVQRKMHNKTTLCSIIPRNQLKVDDVLGLVIRCGKWRASGQVMSKHITYIYALVAVESVVVPDVIVHLHLLLLSLLLFPMLSCTCTCYCQVCCCSRCYFAPALVAVESVVVPDVIVHLLLLLLSLL